MSRRDKRSGWVVAGFLFAGSVLNYIDRAALGVVIPQVRRELGLSNIYYCPARHLAVLYGITGAAGTLLGALTQPLIGLVVDRSGHGPVFAGPAPPTPWRWCCWGWGGGLGTSHHNRCRSLVLFSNRSGNMTVWTLSVALLSAAVGGNSPTYTKDVAPILYKRCVACHRPHDIAPMSLLDYKSARPWAKSIREAVLSRKMPPWFADPRYGHFSNDARLSQAELDTIKAWVDGGAPEGSPADRPAPPVFTEGWQLGKPDIVIDIGEDHVVTPGEDSYDHFIVPTNFTEGRWIRAAEIRPGNRQVVHHVHVLLVQNDLTQMEAASTKNMPSLANYLLREGKLSRIRQDAPVVNDACSPDAPNLPFLRGFQEGGLAAFLPGRPPDVFPEGTAKWVPPGAKLEFVIHYARISGQPQTDRTSVGLYLAPGPPKQRLRRMDLRNFFMSIPAGAPNHEVRRCYDVDSDKLLLSITPHMHYRGKDIAYEVVRPRGGRETLLAVPRYDFNWQLVYRFREPVRIEKGSRLIVTAHYDNSPNNPANPDPSAVIRWGDKSEEEMMTSWIEFLDGGDSPATISRR